MKTLIGQASNLPWWKLSAMTDDEIEEFNRKYLVEVNLMPVFFICKTCNHKSVNVHEEYHGCLNESCEAYVGPKVEPKNVGIKAKPTGSLSVYAVEVWNEAIETAALRVEDTMLHKLVAYEIRKLKK